MSKRFRYKYPDEDTIGKRLNNAIADSGSLITQIENDINSSHGIIRKYINGTSFPTSFMIIRLCERLNISADWLLGLIPERHLHTDWVFVDGEARCKACWNRVETVFKFCPYCGRDVREYDEVEEEEDKRDDWKEKINS